MDINKIKNEIYKICHKEIDSQVKSITSKYITKIIRQNHSNFYNHVLNTIDRAIWGINNKKDLELLRKTIMEELDKHSAKKVYDYI